MFNNNNFISPEKIIIAFVSIIILGMVAFAFSDSFKSISSSSKTGGSSEIKSANLERKSGEKLNIVDNSFSSGSDDVVLDENAVEKNKGIISKFKRKFNGNENDENNVKSVVSADIYDEYMRAYKAINRALEKEYKLYGNKTRINGNPVSKDKMHQMIQNQMTVTQIENDEMIFTTEGLYQYWIVGNEMGINIKTQGDETEWRHAPFCHGYNECKNLNPNSFSLKNNCGKDNDYRLCPADNTGYSYVYNKTLKQVFDMFPDNNPNYYI